MTQSAMAGVGNVYKSETLFLYGVDPFPPVAAYSDEELLVVIDQARELLSSNLGGFPRRTRRSVNGGLLWVYARSGRPCRRCGTTVRMRRRGALAGARPTGAPRASHRDRGRPTRGGAA